MAHEAAINYVLELQTAEERRGALAISRHDILASVRALAGCQRCGFVEQVLAAFDPELGAALTTSRHGATPTTLPLATTPATIGSASPANTVPLASNSMRSRVTSIAVHANAPTAPPGSPAASPASPNSATPGNGSMAPTQLLALLSSSGGSEDLVGLLQFAWKGASGIGVGQGATGAGATSSPTVSETAPSQLAAAGTLSTTSGHCGSGTAQSGTAAPLTTPSPSVIHSGGILALSDTLLSRPRLLRNFLTQSLDVMQALREDVGDCARHGGYPGPTELASTAARLDCQRDHLLERLAAWGVLRAPASPPPPQSQRRTIGMTAARRRRDVSVATGEEGTLENEEENRCREVVGAERDAGNVGDGGGGVLDDTHANGAVYDYRAPAPANENEDADNADDDPELAAAIRLSLQQQTSPGGARVAAGEQPQPELELESGGVHRGQGPGTVRTRPQQYRHRRPAESGCGGQQPSLPSPPPPGESAVPPLSVSAVLTAAAGLSDASVLVDGSVVAGLPEGLRQRVEQLVAQLGQVQQRRGRLDHARQYGILAAGRKLLLILLQLMWAQLNRASSASASAATVAAAMTAAVTAVSSQAVHAGGAEGMMHQTAGAGANGRSLNSARQLPQYRRQNRAPTSASPPLPQQQGLPAPQADSMEPSGRMDTQRQHPEPRQQQGSRKSPPTASRWWRPRYEGLLADLAAGLDQNDMYLEMNPDLDLELDSELDAELHQLELADMGERMGLGGGGGGGVDNGHVGRDGGRGGEEGPGYLMEHRDGDWDAVRNSSSVMRRALNTRQPPALARLQQITTGINQGGEVASSVPQPQGGEFGGAELVGGVLGRLAAWAQAGADAAGRGRGHGECGAPPQGAARLGCRGGGDEGGDVACCGRVECKALREEQAEQLRGLQAQLAACQASQSALQSEVGRLLDSLGEARRVQEQACAALRTELSQCRGEAAALSALGPDELGALAGRLEAALGRVRAAQLQAAADRELLCPVCWEERKGLVFGCGHQTCAACGDKLTSCPICRQPVSLRIRVYS